MARHGWVARPCASTARPAVLRLKLERRSLGAVTAHVGAQRRWSEAPRASRLPDGAADRGGSKQGARTQKPRQPVISSLFVDGCLSPICLSERLGFHGLRLLACDGRTRAKLLAHGRRSGGGWRDAREHSLWGQMESRGSAHGPGAADAGCFVGLSPHGRMGSTAGGALHARFSAPSIHARHAPIVALLVTLWLLLPSLVLFIAILVFVVVPNEARRVRQRLQPLRPRLQYASARRLCRREAERCGPGPAWQSEGWRRSAGIAGLTRRAGVDRSCPIIPTPVTTLKQPHPTHPQPHLVHRPRPIAASSVPHLYLHHAPILRFCRLPRTHLMTERLAASLPHVPCRVDVYLLCFIQLFFFTRYLRRVQNIRGGSICA